MKKLYISIVSIMFCMQQTQSMEQQIQPIALALRFKDFCIQQQNLENAKNADQLQQQKDISLNKYHTSNSPLKKGLLLTTPSNNDNGYTVITKDLADLPKPTPILKNFDELSEKLYTDTITYTEIQQLVKQGAHLDYQKRGWYGPIVFGYANDNSSRSVKNMETAIELKAAIHNIEDEEHTPLTIALEKNHFLNKGDFSAMIQLLIPHENPIVTVYEHEYYDKDNKWYETRTNSQEQKIREYLISCSFAHPNIATIKMLLDLKLMTANRGLRTFAYYKKPNKEVLDLLLAYGANINEDVTEDDYTYNILTRVMQDTFPSNQYIEFLRQMCAAKAAFNKEVLKRMQTIKKDVDAIVSDLESHEPK